VITARQVSASAAKADGRIEVHRLNDRYEDMGDSELKQAVAGSGTCQDCDGKAENARPRKKEAKEKARAAKKEKRGDGSRAQADDKPRLFVLDFSGDMRASAVDNLREEISVLLKQLKENDEVLLRLESGGGLVHSYGLAASQLQRIRDAGGRLTVSVDKVAASGGYMMACVANQIIAAPLPCSAPSAYSRSCPTFHRLLKKNDIDFEMIHRRRIQAHPDGVRRKHGQGP
jgi:serine protease SohB